MNKFFREYKEQEAHEDLFSQDEVSISKRMTGMRLEMNQEMGHGCIEMIPIDNGLCVGLSDYRLKNMLELNYSHLDVPFHFNICLSGTFTLQFGSKQFLPVLPGDIWYGRSLYEKFSCTLPKNQEYIGLSLVLPDLLIEEWLGTACCPVSQNLEKLVKGGCDPNRGTNGNFSQLARSLDVVQTAYTLRRMERITLCDKLHFESRCLELLSLILSLESGRKPSCWIKPGRMHSAVDEAVDILRQEWKSPPTISRLARRVGLTECYLKNGYRKQTGMSVGKYVRQQRMGKALEFLESGRYNIAETAMMVGYSNPSHFAAAFKKIHGHLPSYYTARF